jgi:putative copper resistance protein D
MVEAGLVASRLVHFSCTMILFGSAFFVLYSGPTASGSERLAHLLPNIFRACAIGALLSGLAWFLFTAGNMSGAFDSETLSSVLWETGFGRTWAARAVPMLLVSDGLVGRFIGVERLSEQDSGSSCSDPFGVVGRRRSYTGP